MKSLANKAERAEGTPRYAVGASLGSVELLPQQLVVGFAVPNWAPGVPGAKIQSAERLTRLFEALVGSAAYRHFDLGAPGAVSMGGDTPDNGLQITPPLVQVLLGPQTVTSRPTYVDGIIRTVFRVLGAETMINLGIKATYHVPLPSSSRAFVRAKLVPEAAAHLDLLGADDDPWLGLRLLTSLVNAQVVTTIEPLHADPDLLFIDVSVQHQGAVGIEDIKTRIEEAEQFVTGEVKRYLEAYLESGNGQ